ncbi:MAG: DUF3035 domain-containing protein [Commensalibacter sp.]
MAYKLNPCLWLPVSCMMGAVFLSACSGQDVSRAFGLKRATPDEYTVTTRDPLSMPPSEDLQSPGSKDHQKEESSSQQALEILSPDVAMQDSDTTATPGQNALASEAQNSADVQRSGELEYDKAFVDNIMFWNSGRRDDLAVNADAENKRLQHNLGLGISPDQGATPTTSEKPK